MNVLKHAGPARNPAKKWRRCEAAKMDFAKGQARDLFAGRAGRIGEMYIVSGCHFRSTNCLRVNVMHMKASTFYQREDWRRWFELNFSRGIFSTPSLNSLGAQK